MVAVVVDRPDCYRCRWYADGDAGNVCRVKGVGYFDVAKAKKLVQRRPTRLTGPEEVAKMLAGPVHEPHLAHVNTRKACILMELPDGTSVLLEGQHRATRAVRAGRPIRLRVVTAEESKSLFLGRRRPANSRFRS